MARLYLIIGLISLSAFSWAQYRGVGLFDDTSTSQPTRGSTSHTTFHK